MTNLHVWLNTDRDGDPIVITTDEYEHDSDWDDDEEGPQEATGFIINDTAAERLLEAWEPDESQGLRGWTMLEDTGGTFITASVFGGEISFANWYSSLDGGDQTYDLTDAPFLVDFAESDDE